MTEEKDHNLIELIKDLECIAVSNQERLKRSLKYSPADSVFEFYKQGYIEGITLAIRLGKSYLEKALMNG